MFRVIAYERAHLAGILALCTVEGWMSFASDPDRAHRVLTAPGVTSAVALEGESEGGDVLGFAQLLSDGELQAYLANLLVAEPSRGQGIARSLLEHVHARAGGERVSLLSEEDATGFYASLTHMRRPGFRIYPPFNARSDASEPSETAPPDH